MNCFFPLKVSVSNVVNLSHHTWSLLKRVIRENLTYSHVELHDQVLLDLLFGLQSASRAVMMARGTTAVCTILCNLCGGLLICALRAVGLFLIKRLIFARKPSHLLGGKQTFKKLCRRDISMEGVPLILNGFNAMLL
jgi:hypothetical protein